MEGHVQFLRYLLANVLIGLGMDFDLVRFNHNVFGQQILRYPEFAATLGARPRHGVWLQSGTLHLLRLRCLNAAEKKFQLPRIKRLGLLPEELVQRVLQLRMGLLEFPLQRLDLNAQGLVLRLQLLVAFLQFCLRPLHERKINLEDRDTPVRREALLALVRLREKDGQNAAVAWLTDPKESANRDLAIRCAREMRLTNHLVSVRESLDGDDEPARIQAMVTLSEWGDASSRSNFEAAATSTNARLQRAGQAALRRLDAATTAL